MITLCDNGIHELEEETSGFCWNCEHPDDVNERLPPPPKIRKRPPKQTWAPKKQRRKAVHLACGCSYYGGINCPDGFTHRGVTHVHTMPEWLLFRRSPEPDILQTTQHNNPVNREPDNNSPDQSKPQPSESVGSPDMLAELGGTFSITSSEWRSIIKEI
ncbi:C2 [Nightshade curly top virus]|nr:C2 [Nightshade curly top virus]